MEDEPTMEARPRQRVGRPRRGTEAARSDTLIAAATRVFLRDGYGAASIDKVAAEAGTSTRTIYERFKNKADLLAAIVTRLVDREMRGALAADELARLDPRAALRLIGQTVAGQARDPSSAALFRILASEAHRFPELAAKMRCNGKERINDTIAAYLRGQVERGRLKLSDPGRAAALFLQMVCAELHECLLFGSADEMSRMDFNTHLDQVVEIFLEGALPRPASGPPPFAQLGI